MIQLKKSGKVLESEGRKSASLTPIIALNPSIGEKVTLLPHHLEELKRSGIDSRIIDLNFFSIRGDDVVELLNLSDEPGYRFKYGSVIYYGGLQCGTSFKPDVPRTSKKKPVKYETPVGDNSKPIKLLLPEEIWQAIATKYGVPKPADLDGWLWVEQNPIITIAVAEGCKKAGCLITQTLIPTLAVTGHQMSLAKDEDVRFAEFLHPDRKIIICFDEDISDITAGKTATSIRGIGHRLNPKEEKRKKKKNRISRAKLFITHWMHPEKGIDDIWAAHGTEEVNRIIDRSIPWDHWVDTSFNKLGFAPNVTFNNPKWQMTEIPEESRYVSVVGDKGTGKTWYLTQITLKAKEDKRPVITATHRIQLSMTLAERLQIQFINDVDGKVEQTLQIALVIDSLPKINPLKFRGCIFIIDEVVQVLDHFLLGETCAWKRQAILNTLRELCRQILDSCGKLIIADADLNGSTIRFFSGLMGDEKPFIIQNTFREPSYTCHLSNGFMAMTANGRKIITPADIVATAISKARKGERIYIACTGQKEDSTWGTITLEGLFLEHGITSVIRIDSETIKNPNHPAFKAANKINKICDLYQVVIVSPTLGTGVDIQNKIPFDLVCGIFTGVGTPNGARQALMRIRCKGTQRLIYSSPVGLDKTLLSLGTHSNNVSENVKELVEFQQDILTDHDKIWCSEYPEIRYNQSASACFNEMVASRNKQTLAFKNYIRQGLKDENVQVIDVLDAKEIYDYSDIDPQEIYEMTRTITERKVEEYRTKIIEQEKLDAEKAEQLKSATELTEAEQLALEATLISEKYGGLEITNELLEKDSNGWYEQIKLDYACTVGYDSMKNIQALVANNQLNRGEGEIIEHDFKSRHKILAQVEHIRGTEIIDLVDNGHVFSAADEESVTLYNDLVEQIPTINLIHEQNISPNSFKAGEFNFQLIAIVAALFGVESQKPKKIRVDGRQVRHYTLAYPKDRRGEIYALWVERDTQKADKWVTRHKAIEIRNLVNQITPNISLDELDRLRQLELFNEAWEQTHTDTRIQVINKIDKFSIPENHKILVDATDSESVTEAFKTINLWNVVSLDCETFGNDPKNKEGLHKFKGQLRLLQLSNGYLTYTFDFGKRGEEATRTTAKSVVEPLLQQLLGTKHRTVIGHNLNFDLGILHSNFEITMSCDCSDTMLGIQIFTGIYNGKNAWEGGFGLKTLAKKFLGIDIDKTEQKSDWGLDLTLSQIDYAADDPHITYWLWVRLHELYKQPTKFGFAKLERWDMMDAWKLENACLIPLAEMEQAGLPIDLKELRKLNTKVDRAIRYTLKIWQRLGTNITKPSQVQKLIEHLNSKYGLKLTSGDKKSLADYKEYPEVSLRFTHSGLLQYQARLKKLIRSAEQNQRVKVFYSVLSGTGRTSSGGKFDDVVNIQSIPAKIDNSLIKVTDAKDSDLTTQELMVRLNRVLKKLDIKSLRSAFKIPGNEVLIVSDLAAAHAKLSCDFAQDKLGMIVQNDDNIDSHSLFAIKLAQCVKEQARDKNLPDQFLDKIVTIMDTELLKEFKSSGKRLAICKQLRDVAKNIFYGKLNGASWKRIQAEIRGQLKMVCSDSEAKAISDVFEEMYPELTAYCKLVAKKLESEENQMWIDGKLFGISEIDKTGQRLLFYLKQNGDGEVTIPYTNCVAAQWSRTEATAMKKALILCFKLFRKHPEYEAKIINIVHDELNIECNKDYAPQVSRIVAWVMSRCFQAELKNGVKHGGTDFRNHDPEKYLKDKDGNILLDAKGCKIENKNFEKSIYACIVKSWDDK